MGISRNATEVLVILITFVVVLLITIVKNLCKKNETNKRAEITMAAIEKNPDVDVEEVLRKLDFSENSVKSKLMSKFHAACIFICMGVGLILFGLIIHNITIFSAIGVLVILFGVAFLIAYIEGKKLMKKELEAEEERFLSIKDKEQK